MQYFIWAAITALWCVSLAWCHFDSYSMTMEHAAEIAEDKSFKRAEMAPFYRSLKWKRWRILEIFRRKRPAPPSQEDEG